MKIAIPVTGGLLSPHFGHCEQFALFAVEEASRTLGDRELLPAPPHEPGMLPRWLHERGTTVVIAGGMGARAQGLFAQVGIRIVVGAPVKDPDTIAREFLADSLRAGRNICDH